MKVHGMQAVLVGGASGMGRATAEKLAARGAKVAILDLPSSDGAAVADAVGPTHIDPVRCPCVARRCWTLHLQTFAISNIVAAAGTYPRHF